jgi:hypothetical protein
MTQAPACQMMVGLQYWAFPGYWYPVIKTMQQAAAKRNQAMKFNCRIGSTPSAAGVGPTVLRTLTGVAVGALASFGAHAGNCADAPVSGKNYTILNEASGLALDVHGWSKDDGAVIMQYQSNNAANQQWTVTQVADGSWTLRPVHSGKAMDVSGWGTVDKVPLYQWSYTGYANQLFALRSSDNGTLNIISNYSKKFVTVGDTKAYSTIYQDSERSSAQQRWYFNSVDGQCTKPARGNFSSFMGQNKVLIGAGMKEESRTAAPIDLYYRYLASPPMPDNLDVKAKCPNYEGFYWYACWDGTTPGRQVKGWATEGKSATWQNAAHPYMTLFTYYVMAPFVGGFGDVSLAAMNDAAKMKRYLNDWRFLLQSWGNDRAMVQIEPDLWGLVRGTNKNPHLVPVKVQAANPTDCAYHENSAAGLGRCMIAMARKYAPNMLVGLHASSWHHQDVGDGAEVGKFMLELGAGESDFVTIDVADRDAGWSKKVENKDFFWNDQRFATFMTWSKEMAETIGKPNVLWQVPLGNWQQNNTDFHWQDNKVDYIFSNIDKVADAHIAAVLFGAGETVQTSPETDGGRFFGWVQDYHKKGGVNVR